MPVLSTERTDEGAAKRRLQIRTSGSVYLTDRDLLATFLEQREGSDEMEAAEALLDAAGGDLRRLACMTVPDLAFVSGIDEARAHAIYVAIKLGLRVAGPPVKQPQRLSQPEEVANAVRELLHGEVQEHLVVILLDTKHTVMRMIDVYRGTVCSASVRVAEVVKHAVVANASNMMLAHNHPSGDPTPSPEDAAVTRKVIEACELLDIGFLDHVIVTDHRFVSLQQRGLCPTSPKI